MNKKNNNNREIKLPIPSGAHRDMKEIAQSVNERLTLERSITSFLSSTSPKEYQDFHTFIGEQIHLQNQQQPQDRHEDRGPLFSLKTHNDFFARAGGAYAHSFLGLFRLYVRTPEGRPDFENVVQLTKNAVNQHLTFMHHLDDVARSMYGKHLIEEPIPENPRYAIDAFRQGMHTEIIEWKSNSIGSISQDEKYLLAALGPEHFLLPFLSDEQSNAQEQALALFATIAEIFPERIQKKTVSLFGKEQTIVFPKRELIFERDPLDYLSSLLFQERGSTEIDSKSVWIANRIPLTLIDVVTHTRFLEEKQSIIAPEILVPVFLASRSPLAAQAIQRLGPIDNERVFTHLQWGLSATALMQQRSISRELIEPYQERANMRAILNLLDRFCASVQKDQQVVTDDQRILDEAIVVAQEHDRRNDPERTLCTEIPATAAALALMGPTLIQVSPQAREAFDRILPAITCSQEELREHLDREFLSVLTLAVTGTLPFDRSEKMIPILLELVNEESRLYYLVTSESYETDHRRQEPQQRESVKRFREAMEEGIAQSNQRTLDMIHKQRSTR